MTANPLPTSHFSYCLHRSSLAAFGYYLGQWGYKIDWEMKSEKGDCLGNQWLRSCLSAPSSSFILCSTIPGLGICRSHFWFGWVLTTQGAQRSLLAWSEKGLAPSSSSHEYRPNHAFWLFPIPDYFLFLTASPQTQVSPASIAQLPLDQFAVVTFAEPVSLLLLGDTSPS